MVSGRIGRPKRARAAAYGRVTESTDLIAAYPTVMLGGDIKHYMIICHKKRKRCSTSCDTPSVSAEVFARSVQDFISFAGWLIMNRWLTVHDGDDAGAIKRAIKARKVETTGDADCHPFFDERALGGSCMGGVGATGFCQISSVMDLPNVWVVLFFECYEERYNGCEDWVCEPIFDDSTGEWEICSGSCVECEVVRCGNCGSRCVSDGLAQEEDASERARSDAGVETFISASESPENHEEEIVIKNTFLQVVRKDPGRPRADSVPSWWRPGVYQRVCRWSASASFSRKEGRGE